MATAPMPAKSASHGILPRHENDRGPIHHDPIRRGPNPNQVPIPNLHQ